MDTCKTAWMHDNMPNCKEPYKTDIVKCQGASLREHALRQIPGTVHSVSYVPVSKSKREISWQCAATVVPW